MKVLEKKKILMICAKFLKIKKILAIFDGKPESGPRALGHRSLFI